MILRNKIIQTRPKWNSRVLSSSSFLNSQLVIEPRTCCCDEPVSIKAVDLKPGAKFTLTSATKDAKGCDFRTHLHFLSDSDGVIDLSSAESIGGTYEGVFPMGPIANLVPAPHEKKDLRFSMKDVMIPIKMTFNLLDGHVDKLTSAIPDSSMILDTKLHDRIFMTSGVQRIPIKSGQIRGTLFLPEGEGPFPGVIDLFGTAGGVTEYRAAQLANRGIASLALAYFAFQDLPKSPEQLDIEYFEEAVQFLINHPKIIKSGVGAMGVSKGGDLACFMGSFIPEVKAVVCINGIPVNNWVPMKVKDEIYPILPLDIEKAVFLHDGKMIRLLEMLPESHSIPETCIPLHESSAKFLFLVALDDRIYKVDIEVAQAVLRMKNKGFHDYQVYRYPGAGHLLDPPYFPLCKASYHPMGFVCEWGGIGFDHSEAQVHGWNETLQFFKTTLV